METVLRLTNAFRDFTRSEQAGGAALLACTVLAIGIANSSLGPQWLAFWQQPIAGMTLEHWVNDGLMALFFLLIGLELERELYRGELSNLRQALFPVAAAVGGMALPAAIHYALNAETAFQPGAGIPMATDIAFALAMLSLLGKRVPLSLKVFLTAFAVIDDLGAILVIALAYTKGLSFPHLSGALAVVAVLVGLNRLRVRLLWPYLIGGAALWYLMLRSGVHATVAGVLLAFAIPFTARSADEVSPSARLESFLHKPVAFLVLPIFALANAGVQFSGGAEAIAGTNFWGILLGLVVGKPVGVAVACLVGVMLGVTSKPADMSWGQLIGAGFLGGIGFTMSIFITNLAFPGDPAIINASKIAVLAASVIAAGLGLWLLHVLSRREPIDSGACQNATGTQSAAAQSNTARR